jgi:hypothetical protein
MRIIRKCAVAALAALAMWTAASAVGRADIFIGWGEYDRALQPGAAIPYDGAPFSHRYGFYSGPSFYYGNSYDHFAYLDYLDRLDRAEKFGYRIPNPPAFLVQPPCRPCAK